MPNTGSSSPELPPTPEVGLPLWLLAELTYRCPLHCVFCYNPTRHAQVTNELTTAQWVDVMAQARTLGKLVFYEIDDLLFDPMYPPPLHTYGGYVGMEQYRDLTRGMALFRAAAQLWQKRNER